MAIELYQVDAFASGPFAGNPAAVCLLPGPRDDAWMAQVAGEMNLSETAFLLRDEGDYSLRWFTPTTEVDLCGHATLASAHVLWETGLLGPAETARFQTRSGPLTAQLKDGLIELDVPSLAEKPTPTPEPLAAALGAAPRYVGRFGDKYLLEVETEEDVRQLSPDYAAMRALPERGVAVTSVASTPGYDFVSRYFAPWVGIDEDPVTGSAHCCLGPYWSRRLGRNELRAYQASARGGAVHVRIADDRVRLGGRAITVLKGELTA